MDEDEDLDEDEDEEEEEYNWRILRLISWCRSHSLDRMVSCGRLEEAIGNFLKLFDGAQGNLIEEHKTSAFGA